MRFLHAVFGLMLYVIVVVAAGFIIVAAMDCGIWKEGLALLASWPRYLALSGAVAALLVVILFALTGVAPRKKEEFIAFENEGGTVRITVKAVRDFLVRVGDEFAAVLSMNPRITAPSGSIDIELDVRVKSGTQIPELCKMIQDRIRDTVRETLGVQDVRGIRINVREIVATPAGKPEKKKPEEPADWEGAMRL
jgi:hypothetical protein